MVTPARHRPATRPARHALAGLLLAGLCAGDASAAAPCRARVTLEPARAFVGQHVLHRSEIVRDADQAAEWVDPARFPGFRVERAERPASAERTEAGRVRVVERTALFAVRAGSFRLPDARLRCGGREILVPGARFEARPAPREGRPAGFRGLVGDVAITVGAEPRVRLGESVRIHVTTRGAANLWAAAPTLEIEPDDVEVFPRPARLSIQAGERFRVVRHDAFDLVPRRPGPLRVAPLRLFHLDPGTGRYRMTESEPVEILVVEEGTAAAAGGDRRRGADAGEPDERDGTTPSWALALLLAAGALLAGAGLLMRRRRAPDPVQTALRAAERARDDRACAAALERGLRAALAERSGPTTQATLERSPDATTRECAEMLDALERARFDGTGRTLDPEAVRAVLLRAARR